MTPPAPSLQRPAKLKVAVVLHLFYEDQWPEFRGALANIGQDFDLFVSLRPESRFDAEILRHFPQAWVRAMPNVGRDVAPFLAWLPALQAYDAVCKIHSKRSEGAHSVWRQSIVSELLGTPAVVDSYLAAFAQDPDLVLAGPRFSYVDGAGHLYMLGRALALQHGALPKGWGFFAGTMFWCRPQAFAGLDALYPQDCFIAHGDVDGHPEHVVERAFGIMAMQAGKKIMLQDAAPTIDHPARLHGNPNWHDTYLDFSDALTDDDLPLPALVPGEEPGLMQLYAAHQGHVTDKWTGNLAQYDRVLAPRRNDPVRLLEIGIQNGGSLEIWARYFAKGAVFLGCDIDPRCRRLAYDDPRIGVVVEDAGSPIAKTRIMELCGQFDIVIDDGSHMSSDIIRAFLLYFPVLAEGGLYVAEDLHCSYWPAFEGGVDRETSSLAFFRALSDVINRKHWADDRGVAARFAVFAEAYGIEIDTGIFATITAVEFVNSMVILRKGRPGESGLGRRMVRGTRALVNDAVRAMDGAICTPPTLAPAAPAIAAATNMTVSVVIPFYNGSAYLPEAIRSVAAQTCPPAEVIVVDDGSTPAEAQWLHSFAKDADFRIVTQANTGQGGARNTGLRAARGTHVCLLDQDDLFHPDHNEVLVAHWNATAPDADRLGWIFGDFRIVDGDLVDIGKTAFPHKADPVPASLEDMIARDLNMFPSTTMLDRAAVLEIGGFDEALRGYEDDDLLLRLFLNGYRGSFLPHETTIWRKHAGQTSQNAMFIRSAELFFHKWFSHPFKDQARQAVVRANLRARMLKSLQLHIREAAPDKGDLIWALFHRVEAAR